MYGDTYTTRVYSTSEITEMSILINSHIEYILMFNSLQINATHKLVKDVNPCGRVHLTVHHLYVSPMTVAICSSMQLARSMIVSILPYVVKQSSYNQPTYLSVSSSVCASCQQSCHTECFVFVNVSIRIIL